MTLSSLKFYSYRVILPCWGSSHAYRVDPLPRWGCVKTVGCVYVFAKSNGRRFPLISRHQHEALRQERFSLALIPNPLPGMIPNIKFVRVLHSKKQAGYKVEAVSPLISEKLPLDSASSSRLVPEFDTNNF